MSRPIPLDHNEDDTEVLVADFEPDLNTDTDVATYYGARFDENLKTKISIQKSFLIVISKCRLIHMKRKRIPHMWENFLI